MIIIRENKIEFGLLLENNKKNGKVNQEFVFKCLERFEG